MQNASLAHDYAPQPLDDRPRSELDRRLDRAAKALLDLQRDDGHWVFELEADATIPAEYVLLKHFFGMVDRDAEPGIGAYLRRIQGSHGGWPLWHGGGFNMSASVKAYFALKTIGDPIDAPHMVRAREAILAHGGAAQSNVFTRFLLALFGEVPWTGVPNMPVEIMHLPRWFPFHLSKISYWARTVLVPLLVIQAKKPRAINPTGTNIRELFTTPPELVREWPKGELQREPWSTIFGLIDTVLHKVEPLFPKAYRQKAIDLAIEFVDERLNGEDGLGAIFPAMANAIVMYDVVGVPKDDPRVQIAWKAVELLVVRKQEETYCQPCLSPIWDTGLACHALLEYGGDAAEEAAQRAVDWLKERQVLDVVGDWAVERPGLRPGGWAFQYNNPHYPDTDDTAVVVLALDRAKAKMVDTDGPLQTSIDRATEWILGMQSKNGGWGAFDAENSYEYLNYIPFADHGALLDPPTADVSARCLAMLAQLGHKPDSPAVKAAIDYLKKEQEPDGSWFGRWGTNYVYGTWSVLTALNAAGVPPEAPEMRKAVAWLVSRQNADGGWGEDGDSYKLKDRPFTSESTASQTSWALLALMAAGEVEHPAVDRGIAYLMEHQGEDGFWPEEAFTAVGFPRVFYLRYHGYPKFFPLWAMARYRNLKRGNSKQVLWGL